MTYSPPEALYIMTWLASHATSKQLKQNGGIQINFTDYHDDYVSKQEDMKRKRGREKQRDRATNRQECRETEGGRETGRHGGRETKRGRERQRERA